MTQEKFNPNNYMMKLGGKDYLPVVARVAWFNEEYRGKYCMRTVLLEHDLEHGFALFETQILNEQGDSVANDFGSETSKDFRDYLEKAATKSRGRALAMFGLGTLQAQQDFDEGERIVDAPMQRPQQWDGKADGKALQERLALTQEQKDYLQNVAKQMGRTISEQKMAMVTKNNYEEYKTLLIAQREEYFTQKNTGNVVEEHAVAA